ncbi:general secretion pathway protein GspK [Pseudoxanthomonas kalamensis DSM 18571]|uniref:general secretion pathway protein GspK n=1 Tax=Pseudoxanthomonas kalamensis TaxID=289483 RepID=UPI0013918567|nr:type II secretion system protein GspK [Pseudoxanthomonas kalamensis]KAF1708871.1 general secretion pathway protein GspK [Pseudoxanthomonas kalamensis DSM 18571]
MKSRGAALVLVLWLVAMLTALIGGFALSARVEALQGKLLRDGVAGEEIARAGIEYALVRLVDEQPKTRWLPDGRAYAWHFADAELRIRIVDETGKVDLNQADVGLLSALMQVLGSEPAQAEAVAAAIVDWRDEDSLTQPVGGAEDPDYAAAGLPYGAKDAPFETVAEVEQVLGMTPELFARMQPFLTLHAGRVMPDPNLAPEPVLRALGLDPAEYEARRQAADIDPAMQQFIGAGSGTYSIESRARLADGRTTVLRRVVRAGSGPIPASAYVTLRQDSGFDPR